VAAVIADPRVRAVTLTGSESAGSQVAEQAGRHLKKTVLELGGSDAFIVEDADLPRAAKTAADARLINSGQICIAAKRLIVVNAVADRFEALFGELEVGCVFVNGMVKSDPHLPCGGVKRSGYGRGGCAIAAS
jgi:succinate-semialdehyde dehydrogenase/glutarate-semialdehyde dehydrogenase